MSGVVARAFYLFQYAFFHKSFQPGFDLSVVDLERGGDFFVFHGAGFLFWPLLGLFKQGMKRQADGASGATDLLVVGDDRAWGLVVDDKGQVRFVIAHAQCRGGYQGLDPVVEQGIFQLLAPQLCGFGS